MALTILLLMTTLSLSLAADGPMPTLAPDDRHRGNKDKAPHPRPVVTGTLNVTVNNITYEVQAEVFQRISRLFGQRLDLNHDGNLDRETEGRQLFAAAETEEPQGLNQEELAASPFADWTDYLAKNAIGLVSDKEILALIDSFDLDGDGYVNLPEVLVFKIANPLE